MAARQTVEERAEIRRDADEGPLPPPSARVRDEDLEPHEGLRYIARLFKALAILLLFMLVAEVIIGLQQDGSLALMTLLIEATRTIVFASFLWAAGDLAIMFIESNHDLRATRILLGRLNGRMERAFPGPGVDPATTRPPPPPPPRAI